MIENVSRFSHFSLFTTPFTVKPGSSFSSHGQFEFDRRVTANMKVIKSQRNSSTLAISPRGPLWKRPCFKTAPIKSKIDIGPKTILLSLKKQWWIQGRGPGGALIFRLWDPMFPKNFFETDPAPTYLEVWIRHWKKLRFSFIPYCLPKIK